MEFIVELLFEIFGELLLQLLIESLIVKKYFGLDFGRNRYLVQETSGAVIRYDIPAWMGEREEVIWDTFTAFAKRKDVSPPPRKRKREDGDAGISSAPSAKRRRLRAINGN